MAGVLLALPTVAAAEADFKLSPAYEGLAASYIVTSAVKGEADTVVVGFKQSGEVADLSGGLAVLRLGRDDWTPAWGCWFDGYYPSNITVSGRDISMKLIKTTLSGEETRSYALVYGKDYIYLHEQGGPFTGAQFVASSTLAKGGAKPEAAFDGDPLTAWAEGAEGTGIDEWVAVKFARPQNVGIVGIIPGLFPGKGWKDSNRVNRGELKLDISEEKGDAASKIDFEKDLGLTIGGDTVDLMFPNRKSMRFFEVKRRAVKELKVVITSIYLGDKNDDTYIAEIIPFTYISLDKKAAPATDAAKESPKADTAGAVDTEKAVEPVKPKPAEKKPAEKKESKEE